MHLIRVLRATGAVMVATLLYGTAALADSVIAVSVLNAETKQPVADVVVTAKSPTMIGEQTVVTDATGAARIPQLTPGNFTIRFEKESFKPLTRGDVVLRLDKTVLVKVELLPEAFTETVEVVGRAPTIDVGSTTTGLNVDQDFIKRIAVNRPTGKGGATRSFESLAELAPGAQNDTYGVSINGTTSPENGYVVDGLSTNNPAYGINASPMSVEFVQDVNVITGGYMPEYGRSTGGVINAVTKSGSNEFRGSVFGNWTPGALEGARTPIVSDASVVSGRNQLWNVGDFGATLGGPILKDKLWFFAGVVPSFTRYRHTRTINSYDVDANGNLVTDSATGFTKATPIPGTEQNLFADARTTQFMGKLTYLINQDHNLSLSVNAMPTQSGARGRLGVDPDTGGVASRIPSSVAFTTSAFETASNSSVALKYAGAFMDKKLLLDANVGWFHLDNSTLPVDGTRPGDTTGLAGTPRVRYVYDWTYADFEDIPNVDQYCGATRDEKLLRCPAQAYSLGGPGFIAESVLDRVQVNAKATYLLNFLGQHVIKAGADVENLSYAQSKAFSGTVYLSETDLGGGNIGWIDLRRYGYQTGPDSPVPQLVQQARTASTTVGGFLQDSWTIANRVTVNAGVRYDTQMLYGGNGQLAMILANQWSPRVGVIVDPFANGQMKLYGSFSRFYEQVPLDMMDRAFPGERRYTGRYNTPAASSACGADLSKVDPLTLKSCLEATPFQIPESSRNPNRSFTGGKVEPEPVDPFLQPQSSDELSVGAEYEVLANTRLGVNGIHRYMVAVIEDMSRDDGNTYFIGNPGEGFAKDFPDAERDYWALNIFLTRAFSDGWLAQASYTLSTLTGNYAGLFRPENGQLDPNINSDFDLISPLPNRSGPLPFDRTHQIKLFGAKEFAFTKDLTASIGMSYRGTSGAPLNYMGAHPEYGADEAFILPRGAAGRTDWVNVIDSNVGVNYRISKDSMVSFTLDVFNLFNFQTPTGRDQTYTLESVLPVKDGTTADLPTAESPGKVLKVDGTLLTVDDLNKNFGKPIGYQSPRQFRFGIRYTF